MAGVDRAWSCGARLSVGNCAESAAQALALQPLGEALALAADGPPVLAFGAWFKNAPCLVHGRTAQFAHTVGDLDRAGACQDHDAAIERLCGLFVGEPAAVAHDLHPDFHSSRAACAFAARRGLPAIAVQHHHAHVAAVLAECGHGGPALGLALDGVGLGTDGQAWGGELLRVEGAEFARLGHLRALPLAGGDRAAREPWRMAAAVLHALGRADEIGARFAGQPAAARLGQVLERPHLCAPTTSMGRVFDAAAGLLGVCEVMKFEAEAAIALEAAAAGWPDAAPLDRSHWALGADGGLDLLPLLAVLADERDVPRGAARFHATLIAALAQWIERAAQAQALATVVLSGGCFHNRILSAGLAARLRGQGLEVLEARRLSPGDAGLALGQAWVARRILEKGN